MDLEHGPRARAVDLPRRVQGTGALRAAALEPVRELCKRRRVRGEVLDRGPGLPAFNRYFQPTTAGRDERFWRAAKSRTSLRNFLNFSEHLWGFCFLSMSDP